MTGELSASRRNWIAAAAVGAGIGLSLFARWEPGGESWGYWFFARVLRERGEWIIPGRSPLYVLYLCAFRWMGYPLRVSVEYAATMGILAASMAALLRRRLGPALSAFAVLLWVPFFQTAEPPVQSLALACACLAAFLRDGDEDRFRTTLSYVLLGCAALFRTTYVLLIAAFGLRDAWRSLRGRGLAASLRSLRPGRRDWPLLPFLLLAAWILARQSPHPWNNAWMATTRWFPSDGKSLSDASFLQSYNANFIQERYGSFEGRDFFFTNRELFGGADTMAGAALANPRFVAARLFKNAAGLPAIALRLTAMPDVYAGLLGARLPLPVKAAGYLALVAAPMSFVLYGAFRACGTRTMALFLAGGLCVAGSTVLSFPKPRYMHTLVPVLILSAHFWGEKLRASVEGGPQSVRRLAALGPAFMLVLFSNAVPSWGAILAGAAEGLRAGRLPVLEARGLSMKASFGAVAPLLAGRRGVLSLEALFWGAHADVPLDRLYDPWEIPPFGALGRGGYAGLAPRRIDCVLASRAFSTEAGTATNVRLRYRNYVAPYIEELKKTGAEAREIDGYGEAVVLRDAPGGGGT